MGEYAILKLLTYRSDPGRLPEGIANGKRLRSPFPYRVAMEVIQRQLLAKGFSSVELDIGMR